MKRILVVRRDNIGDLVCTTPLIRALRQRYPDARIDALVNSYNLPVVAHNPDLDNAYAYQGQQLRTSHAEGPAKLQNQITIPAKNQFAAEMDHFSECVLEDKKPHTPGEEGLQDQRIMEAIYQSAREGRPVKLPEVKGTDVFRGPEPKQA